MVRVRAGISVVVALWMVVAPFAHAEGYPVGRAWRMYDGFGSGTCRVTYSLDGRDGVVPIDRLAALGEPPWARASTRARRLTESQLPLDLARVCQAVGPGLVEQQATCAGPARWRAVAPARRMCLGPRR